MVPEYWPGIHHNPDAALADLLTLDWLKVTDARLEYFMSDVPRSYVYGKGAGQREYFSSPFSATVADILSLLNARKGCDYNVCFLNRYDHQKHQLGWHADDSPTMDRDHPIAVVSFGAEREIWWRKNGEAGVVPAENRRRLGHGSLFVMPARFQDSYQHRIPKSDRECGVRVSLTFRRYVG
jgi:alkylated DNA repair dioxygenase AlkB